MPETIVVSIPHLKGEYRLPWYSYKIYTVKYIISLAKKFYPEDIERPKRLYIRDSEGRLQALSDDQKMDSLVAADSTDKYLKLLLVPVARGIERPVVAPYIPPTKEEENDPSFFEKPFKEPLGITMDHYIKRSCPVIWDDATAECSICLDSESADDFRRIPGCGHLFHSKCIIEWLSIGRKMSCPLCRTQASIQ